MCFFLFFSFSSPHPTPLDNKTYGEVACRSVPLVFLLSDVIRSVFTPNYALPLAAFATRGLPLVLKSPWATDRFCGATGMRETELLKHCQRCNMVFAL